MIINIIIIDINADAVGKYSASTGCFLLNKCQFTLLHHLESNDKTPSHDNQNESSLILMIILPFGQYCVTRIILTICWHENRIYTDDTYPGQEDAHTDGNNYA